MAKNSIDMENNGAVLGIFFGVATILTLFFLNRVQGKVYRIQDYLAARKWHLFESESTVARINKMLLVTCWIFFFLPPITLIFWGSGLIARYDEFDRSVMGGVAVFLVGFALLFFLFGVFKIKWNRYRISKISGACLFISILLLTAYQIAAVFVDNDESFFGLSAIFLTANAIVMIVVTFLNSSRTGTSISEIVTQLPEGPPLDINRPITYDEEITQAYEQDDYLPTQNEIFEMFTISKVTKRRKMLGPFEGGFLKLFTGMSTFKRVALSLILYFLALIILGVYALLDYLVRDDSSLGIITAIAVVFSDFIMYLYSHSEIVSTPAEISLHLVVFRICLFVLGGDYWIYGYCILYIYFGSYLCYNIALKRFPFMDELIDKELDSLNENEEEKRKLDLAKTPEFLLTLCTVAFALLMGIMEAVEPDDVPLKDYEIETKRYEFWVYGLFSVLIVFIVFFLVLVYRVFKRKRNGIEGKMYIYVHYKHIDLFWFFLLVLYGLICLAAVLLWWITDDKRYLIVGILAPLSFGFLLNAYLKFALNDFRYWQDVSKINKIIEKHNKKIEGVKRKVKDFKKNLAEQTGSNPNQLKLTPEEIEELSKSKMEYHKKGDLPEEDEDEEEQQLNNVEDEESKHPAEPKEEALEENLQYDEDEVIEEGGSDEENKVEPGSEENLHKHVDSIVPHGTKTLFNQKVINRDNMFGRVTSMLLNDDAIDYDKDYPAHVKASKKFKKLYDWREHTNRVFAFFSGKLRPNDYHIAFSWMIAVFILVIMSIIICVERDSTEGVSWGMAFLYVFCSYGIMVRPIACDGELHKPETVVYVLSLAIFFAWALIDFAIRFDFDPDEDNDGHYFLVWYCEFIPWFVITTTCLYKWYDKNWDLGKFVMISLAGSIISGIVVLVCCYVFIGPVSGSIILGLVVAIMYAIFIMTIYVKNGKYLPRTWKIINFIVLSLVAITTFIVSLVVDDFTVFTGWSITYAIFVGMIFFYGASDMLKDLSHAEEEPIYFSPWVFPVFKYDTNKNDIKL